MAISVFNLFSIGIGPSSSHTVGPMRAARQYVLLLQEGGILSKTESVKVDLYGSLALTGKGHGTDAAILLGLSGMTPEGVEPNQIKPFIDEIRQSQQIRLIEKTVPFNEAKNLLFHYDQQLPYHPNGMRFTAYDANQHELFQKVFYSVGGGFIVDHETARQDKLLVNEQHPLPYPFKTSKELLESCHKHQMKIRDLMLSNEKTWRSESEVKQGLLKIWSVMKECINRGCQQEGILPGGLGVKRRAHAIFHSLTQAKELGKTRPTDLMEWVSLWALAVNEENAAGGRVVTAPTNGSAGVIPAVMRYYETFIENPSEDGLIDFMLTAGAIGILYKEGASISAAEMGCMGEVGVACSMAAAGLTASLGGTNEQIENAAEIGMEHNLGLTCDPIKGLVQIPCIERNTMGAIKAINASLLALRGDGTHRVSLDQVIATMRQTGKDMNSIYKETSQGGLAVNVPEC
jgi:L-serine dehydratase